MSQNFCLKKKTQSFDFSMKFEYSVSLQASDSCGYGLNYNINKLQGSKDGRVGMHSFQIVYKKIQCMCKYVTLTRFTFHMHGLELWALLYSLIDEGPDAQKAP